MNVARAARAKPHPFLLAPGDPRIATLRSARLIAGVSPPRRVQGEVYHYGHDDQEPRCSSCAQSLACALGWPPISVGRTEGVWVVCAPEGTPDHVVESVLWCYEAGSPDEHFHEDLATWYAEQGHVLAEVRQALARVQVEMEERWHGSKASAAVAEVFARVNEAARSVTVPDRGRLDVPCSGAPRARCIP